MTVFKLDDPQFAQNMADSNVHRRKQNRKFDVSLVLVHAPWCPHCSGMRPEWDALVQTLEKNAPELNVLEYDRSTLPSSRKCDDPMISALDAQSADGQVHSVPHIVLVIQRKDEPGPDVLNYEEFENPGPYRSQGHILEFIHDRLSKAPPSSP